MENSQKVPEAAAGVAGGVNVAGGVDGSTNTSVKIDYVDEARKLQEKSFRFMAKQTHPVIIPSFAAWFDLSKVHELERKAMPDFFGSNDNYKNKETYMEARNFMVNTFRLTPYEYLTITAVRKNLVLDVASVMKIHSFLENWGLINYQIDPRSKQTLRGKKYFGNYKTVLDVPEGLEPFFDKQPHKEMGVDISLQKRTFNSTTDYNLLISDSSTHSLTKPKIYVCYTCGNDIGKTVYHNLRAKEMNICPRCYKEGHFSSNFQASDFLKLNNLNNDNNMVWTDDEVLLLLEGIELYEDKWDRIADHVGNYKTVEECVQKFITLPIEDQYIKDVVKKDTERITNRGHISEGEVNAFIALLDQNCENPSYTSEDIIDTNKIQELTSLVVDKVTKDLATLDVSGKELAKNRSTYFKDSEKLLNDKISLNKQTVELNNELKAKKIYKTIKTTDSLKSHFLIKDNSEIRNEIENASSLCSQLINSEVQPISIINQEAYHPLVL